MNQCQKCFLIKILRILEYLIKNKKLNYLNKLNVDFVITKKFNKKFSKTLKSIEFIENIFEKEIKSKIYIC